MERITSRKNGYIAYLRRLASEGALRRERGETVLDGEKLLGEALSSGCEVTSVLSDEARPPERLPEGAKLYWRARGARGLCLAGEEQPRPGVHGAPAWSGALRSAWTAP